MITGDEGSQKRESRVSSLAQGGTGGRTRRLEGWTTLGPHGLGQVLRQLWLLTLVCLCFLAADLAECKLVSFPIGIYKVLRNVTDQIHLITLANNELKSLTSKFMTTFCQLQGRPWSAQLSSGGHGQPSSSSSDTLGRVVGPAPSAAPGKSLPGGGFEDGPVSFLKHRNLCRVCLAGCESDWLMV